MPKSIMQKPQVSIIILNYDTFDFTCACIQSIREKTKEVSYEIIVVDNNSRKDDPQKIKELFPEIKLIISEKNLGFAKGNNLGITHAKADVILLQNSDTILKNDAVSICYSFLQSKSKAAVVSARLEYPDGEIQPCAMQLPEIKYSLIELFRLQKLMSNETRQRTLLGGFFNHNFNTKAGWVWGTFFMFKRELLQKFEANKLPDDFFMYNEDMQWGVETKRAGYETWFCADAQVIHYEGKNKKKNEMVDTNFAILMKKYYGKNYFRLYQFIPNNI